MLACHENISFTAEEQTAWLRKHVQLCSIWNKDCYTFHEFTPIHSIYGKISFKGQEQLHDSENIFNQLMIGFAPKCKEKLDFLNLGQSVVDQFAIVESKLGLTIEW